MADRAPGDETRGAVAVRRLASRIGAGILFSIAAALTGAYVLRERARAPSVTALERQAASFVPGPTRPDELEGWGVRWRAAVLAGLGVFLLIGATLAGAYAFYEHAGAPTMAARPAMDFPAPTLNARLDRDPRWSFAPPEQQIRDPDPQVRKAMADLAAEGDAVYDTPGRAP